MPPHPITKILTAPRKGTKGSLILVEAPAIPSLPFAVEILCLNLIKTILLKSQAKITTISCTPAASSSSLSNNASKLTQINLFHRQGWVDSSPLLSVYDEIMGAVNSEGKGLVVDNLLGFIECCGGDLRMALRTLQRLQRTFHPIIIATAPTFFDPVTHRLIEDFSTTLISLRYNTDSNIGMHCVKKSTTGKVVQEYCVCELENNEFVIVEEEKEESESRFGKIKSSTNSSSSSSSKGKQPKVALEMSEDLPHKSSNPTSNNSNNNNNNEELAVKPMIFMDDDDVEFEDLDSDDPDDDLDL
ncbi:hypothetical protein TL16_g11594 [Triparma laevis f. inornata]|uniref:Elongator complex protein 5 n=2 Tax=Triparma laevis TaxID=1534972 RepID=A0A9W7APW8_9STRA|nr:hypothetical protein TrLO_g15851 [Triparma laevis f. longispina]GMH89881.1 hypothetical protein TL16_g11594 [Triparma laevis f. inornata]